LRSLRVGRGASGSVGGMRGKISRSEMGRGKEGKALECGLKNPEESEECAMR
jgi:hypothetical protein